MKDETGDSVNLAAGPSIHPPVYPSSALSVCRSTLLEVNEPASPARPDALTIRHVARLAAREKSRWGRVAKNWREREPWKRIIKSTEVKRERKFRQRCRRLGGNVLELEVDSEGRETGSRAEGYRANEARRGGKDKDADQRSWKWKWKWNTESQTQARGSSRALVRLLQGPDSGTPEPRAFYQPTSGKRDTEVSDSVQVCLVEHEHERTRTRNTNTNAAESADTTRPHPPRLASRLEKGQESRQSVFCQSVISEEGRGGTKTKEKTKERRKTKDGRQSEEADARRSLAMHDIRRIK
ncbi:hypothetical protein C8R45DRAFT_1189629 [Mycena sanguinolenta]|nr:hypothetical protein C8R45DRAFT_1189629 [Mycena sanguinolenta]